MKVNSNLAIKRSEIRNKYKRYIRDLRKTKIIQKERK